MASKGGNSNAGGAANNNAAVANGNNNNANDQVNGPVVHARADSDTILNDLFAIVQPGNRVQLQVGGRFLSLS